MARASGPSGPDLSASGDSLATDNLAPAQIPKLLQIEAGLQASGIGNLRIGECHSSVDIAPKTAQKTPDSAPVKSVFLR